MGKKVVKSNISHELSIKKLKKELSQCQTTRPNSHTMITDRNMTSPIKSNKKDNFMSEYSSNPKTHKQNSF